MQITYALGPSSIVMFFSVARHERTGWETYDLSHSVGFSVHDISANECERSKAGEIAQMAIAKLQKDIEEDLEARYPGASEHASEHASENASEHVSEPAPES